MKTTGFSACLTSDGHLFEVITGVDGDIALDVAGELTEGVGLILERLYDAVNDGDLIYTGELQALRVMADLSSALVLSVRSGAKREKNNDK